MQLRTQQREAAQRAEQPPLFELRDDKRPEAERSAAGRYRERTVGKEEDKIKLRLIM